MNQTQLFTQFDKLLNDAINAKIKKKLDKLQSQILDLLDPEYHQVAKDCITSHSYSTRIALKLTATRKARVKREIDPDTRCLARIGLGSQCSRSRINESLFCKSHSIFRRYGQIDIPEPLEKKIAKRRGRRSNKEKEYTIDDLDMDQYVQAILLNINDEPYLLDQNNILYQFNSNNEIVGHLVDEKVEWY